MAFKDTRLWKAWNTVTNFFTWRDNNSESKPQATPTTTTVSNNTNITQPSVLNKDWTVLGNPTNTNTLNETIAKQSQESKTEDSDAITTQPINTTSYYDISSTDKNKISQALDEREKESKEHWWETLWRNIKSAVTWISNLVTWQIADSEYQANEQKTYIGYDNKNWNMYELVLDTDWVYGAQDKFNKAYQEFNDVASWNVTQEQWLQAYDNFYNQVSWLFKAQADDWYSDWLIFSWSWATKLWRRKDNFSDDELNILAQTWITSNQKVIPTPEQLLWYLQAQQSNRETYNNIQNKYKTKEDALELDNSIQWRAQEAFLNRAMLWVVDTSLSNLKGKAIQSYPIRAAEITESIFWRAWDYAEPLLEEATLTKLLAQREWRELTEEEKAWIAEAEKITWMLNSLADWLNYYFKDNANANWVDNNWNITWVKDVFSDGRDLWWVISKPVLDASWLDTDNWRTLWNWQNMSWIDAFQEVANKWRYNLDNAKSWSVARGWNAFQRWMWKVWDFLSEVGQQTVGWLTQLWNTYMDMASWNVSNLYKKWWTKEKSISQLADYINQDFTIGKMLTTEETWIWADLLWQTWSRTARKYLLQLAEYTPELAWNIIPDILLYSTWIWEVWAIGKWTQWLKNSSYLQKAERALESVWLLKKAEWVAEWTKLAAEALSESADAPNWIKVWMQWLDKWLTNWIIDQTIDAQYSWYDTEAYSTPSMALSLWGTFIFETIPRLWKSWVLKMWKNALSWRDALDWTTWDVINFFSDEANKDAINRIANVRFATSPNWLTFDNFRALREDFEEMKSVTKQYWDKLPDNIKTWVNQRTKENMYRMLSQVYNLDSNSTIAKNVWAIVTKDWANPADIAKYLWWLPWNVEVGPRTSTIKLKNANWTNETLMATSTSKTYQDLDAVVDWWLDNALNNWFTKKDIDNISTISWYKGVNESYFTKQDDGKYYITKEWVESLGIDTKDMPETWVARELNKTEAPEISNKFKELMKGLRNSNKQISEDTIELVANSQTYQDIREKVADIVC